MPTITSQRTGPAARRSRRRQRQKEKRMSITFPHRQRNRRRFVPKRQLREQSADVDECFEDCRELGYHLDPDVRVGNSAPHDNPFSILDPHYSSSSTPDPIPTPYQDHTIRPLNPFLAELEWQVAKKSYPKLEDVHPYVLSTPESETASLRGVRKRWWRSSTHVDDDVEANRPSRGTPSPWTAQDITAPSVRSNSISADVKVPGSYPQEIDNIPLPPLKKRKLNDAPPPSFLTSYRIPSPLLYHKPSRDTLPNIDDEKNTCIYLGPCFEHEDASAPGSGRLIAHSTPGAKEPPLQKEYHFVAAALPKMGVSTPSSPVEQAAFSSDLAYYTNTRPYLSPQRSASTPEAGTVTSLLVTQWSIPALAKANKSVTHIYATEDVRSTATPLLHNDTVMPFHGSSLLQQPAPRRQSSAVLDNDDLIFPKLSAASICHNKSLDRYFERTTNFWSKEGNEKQHKQIDPGALNNDTVDYVEDRPSKFQELWDAYERAVLDPKKEELKPIRQYRATTIVSRKPPTHGVASSRHETGLWNAPLSSATTAPIDITLPKDVNLSPCSQPKCTQLVPAKLYEQQYLGLMRRWNSDLWNLEQRPLPTTNKVLKEICDDESHNKIPQAVDWLTEDLELGHMFDAEGDEAENSWLQAGWDGHLLYPGEEPSSVPLPLSSPFEDVELEEEEYAFCAGKEGGVGTRAKEDSDDETWFDWDDDADGWSEPSEDDFFAL